MISYCIKINSLKSQKYLLEKLQNCPLSNIIYSLKHFKIYDNIILHYTGDDIEKFKDYLSSTLCETIINIYEPILLKKIFFSNYFYFSEYEQTEIFQKLSKTLQNQDDPEYFRRFKILKSIIFIYINENTRIFLDGFIRFRIKKYIDILDEIIDLGVNEYLIQQEYTEFISLLKLYISSKTPECNIIHLIYQRKESILLDEDKNLICFNEEAFKTKYLSDITFSSNDYALNTLLAKLPQKIIVHLISPEDEFINTLELIFEDKIEICNDCSICKTYKLLNNVDQI